MTYENDIDRIRLAQDQVALEAAAARLEEEKRKAQRRVQFFPSVGKFIIPTENTWAAHAQLVKDDKNALHFDPGRYVYFDKVVAEKSGIQALWDHNHRDYAKYEGLRTNLEVMRNDIIGMYLNDGSFDPGDERYVPLIQGVATALGEALGNDRWMKRAFTSSVSVDVANVEGIGAAQMYKYLLSIQTQPGVAPSLVASLKAKFDIPDHAWGLPPIEETPFGPAGLAAPPPGANKPLPIPPAAAKPVAPEAKQRDREAEKPQQAAQALPPKPEPPAGDPMDRLVAVAESMVQTAKKLRSVDELEEPPRAESVDEARKILRWLRNLEFTDKEMEEWLDHGMPETKAAKAEAVQKLVAIFSQHMQQLGKHNHDRLRDAAVENAVDTAATMALAVAETAHRLLPGDHPDLGRLEVLIDGIPAAADRRVTQSFSQLLDTMELGMERAAGRQVGELTPVERLIAMGDRVQAAAYRLRAIDRMEPPAREESIELAREILRRMRVAFSHTKVEEFIETGRPEDKAAFAQQAAELAELYQGLVAEAAKAHPEIMQNTRIKEASQAIGEMVHSIKLMAAKEIPNNAAQTQQIGADLTRMPGEWGQLHDRTVERLLDNAEQGVEEAIEQIEQQQQAEEQDRDQELANEIAEGHSSDQHRRKRRRKRPQRSGKSGKKQAKKMRDINADDYALKQGRFAQENNLGRSDVQIAALQGMKPEDLAVIRQFGGALREIGNQIKELNASMATVTTNERLSPDDKTTAQRVLEDQQRQNPRTTGPRVQ